MFGSIVVEVGIPRGVCLNLVLERVRGLDMALGLLPVTEGSLSLSVGWCSVTLVLLDREFDLEDGRVLLFLQTRLRSLPVAEEKKEKPWLVVLEVANAAWVCP